MSLCAEAWRKLLESYPDPTFGQTLGDIVQFGAKVGYEGPPQATRRPNLA